MNFQGQALDREKQPLLTNNYKSQTHQEQFALFLTVVLWN